MKVTPFFVLYPFYRYHTQTAANYFAPYLEHSVGDEYYTSDYDLAAFTAHKVGLGLRYSPVYGIGRFRVPGHDAQGRARVMRLKSLDLRYAHYRRSTDLHGRHCELRPGLRAVRAVARNGVVCVSSELACCGRNCACASAPLRRHSPLLHLTFTT